jgi:hypothetical protein
VKRPMAPFYKTFQRVRQSLPLLALAAFLVLGQPVAAQEMASPYTVQNVNVDVSADNALKAREMAFEQAQIAAFEELATRMLEGPELTSFTAPPAMTISSMIQDYEVTDEKISSKRYSGTYTFRFQQNAVQKYFNRAAPLPQMADGSAPAPYGQDAAPAPQAVAGSGRGYLVLPFIDMGGRTQIWAPSNLWLKAWGSAGTSEGAPVPTVAPLGDLDDVRGLNDNEALTVAPQKLAAFLSRYGAAEAVIAIARKMPTGGLTIDLYRTDSAEPRFARQITIQPVTGDEALYTAGVREVRNVLQGDWKKSSDMPAYASNPYNPETTYVPAASVAATGGNTLSVHVAFSSLQEWSQIQRSLAKTYGIQDIALKALSPHEAYLEVRHSGDIAAVQTALGQSGLTLTPPRAQNVSANGMGTGAHELGLRSVSQNGAAAPSNDNNPYQARF